jgi:hypothetical protein
MTEEEPVKRMLLNLSAFAIIAGGGFALATPASAEDQVANTCTAGSGASCSGVNCCADANQCWADCPPPVKYEL